MDKNKKKQLAYLLAARMSIPFDDFRSIRNVSIANFIATDDTRIMKLLVGIDPVQSGSGDPSPDNVRPISGFTGLTLTRTGKNLLGTGTLYAENTLYSISGVPSSNNNYNTYRIKAVASGAMVFSATPADGNMLVRALQFTSGMVFDKTLISSGSGTASVRYQNTILPDADGFVLFCVRKSATDSMIEVGSALSDYIQHQSSTYPVSWQSEAGTVYGGTLDVVSGLLTATHANIASYDGENINEPWISSMDVYSSGGTPTTGAQVVYPLAAPQTYQLDPVNIQPLLGENNIWADTGDILILDLNY